MYVPRSQRMLDQYLQEIGTVPLLTPDQEVDLAQRIKRLTACPGEIVFQPLHYTDVELRIPNVDKARELLGFEARVELDEGLGRTIAWYRSRSLTGSK